MTKGTTVKSGFPAHPGRARSGAATSIGGRLAAQLALLVASSAPAAADSTFCALNYAPGTAGFAPAWTSGSHLCADAGTTGGFGWEPQVVLPDAAATEPVAAAQTGSSGGAFAASADASSMAEPGLLRPQANAMSMGTPPSVARASGRANATFLERGSLEPLGGAAPGAPVDLVLTIDVDGAFTGTGAGDGQVSVYRNGQVAEQRAIFLYALSPTFHQEVDLAGFAVGDEVGLWMRLTALADATDEVPDHDAASADLGSSGHLYLDVTSGNAAFASTSGHDYRAAPEPAAPLLLAAGTGMLAALRGARSRSGGSRAQARRVEPEARTRRQATPAAAARRVPC